jgi:hypothetical protein
MASVFVDMVFLAPAIERKLFDVTGGSIDSVPGRRGDAPSHRQQRSFYLGATEPARIIHHCWLPKTGQDACHARNHEKRGV